MQVPSWGTSCRPWPGPGRWQTAPIRSSASPRSWIVNRGSSRSLAVHPQQAVPTRGTCRPTRWRSDVGVAQHVGHAVEHLGGGPAGEGQQQDPVRRHACEISQATRCTSVVVLPVPAPAMINSGSSAVQAALALRSFSRASKIVGEASMVAWPRSARQQHRGCGPAHRRSVACRRRRTAATAA